MTIAQDLRDAARWIDDSCGERTEIGDGLRAHADDLRAAVNWLYGDEHDALCKRLLAHADAGEVVVTREQLERWAQSLHGCNRHGVMHGEIEALIANALHGNKP